jgi:hypothetical protein
MEPLRDVTNTIEPVASTSSSQPLYHDFPAVELSNPADGPFGCDAVSWWQPHSDAGDDSKVFKKAAIRRDRLEDFVAGLERDAGCAAVAFASVRSCAE